MDDDYKSFTLKCITSREIDFIKNEKEPQVGRVEFRYQAKKFQ